MALVSVYRAADEFTALTIRDLLRQSGIGCVLRNEELPMYGGVTLNLRHWGEVMVEEADANKATELIAGFEGTLGELAEAEPIDMPEEE